MTFFPAQVLPQRTHRHLPLIQYVVRYQRPTDIVVVVAVNREPLHPECAPFAR